MVVRAVISDRLTMREAAARFNLSAEILVRRWLDVYNDAGAEGLLNIQCGMLDGAFPKLRPGDAPLLHSDQGWHYRMRSYQERLKAHGMTQSMSRKGNCLDNAVMENFFGTLKSECFYLREFRSVSALRKAVEDYIHYYNNERISLKLKGLSPVEYRTQALRAA
ncbi:IS3 family transposase [Klebsiella pneumoniae]|uniref:IS3 family transposase n=1 Tax=Klebsiella pneumoniae TaxID=573 RepID=UPI0039763CB1